MQSRDLAAATVVTLAVLHGVAQARPELTVVRPADLRLAFGRVPFETASAPQRIVLRNDGDPARVVDFSASGFLSVVATGGGLGTGEERFWDVVCTPRSALPEFAFLDIELCGASCEDDSRISFQVDCVGGLLDALATPAFFVAYQYETTQEILGFTNPGPDPITVTALASHDPAFAAAPASGSLPVTLAAGERLEVAVQFTAMGGDVTSSIDVLAGTSIVARGDLFGLQRSQVDPVATDLGLVPLGTVYTMPVSVRNSFPTARTITAMSSSRADCVVTGLLGAVVAPGGFAHGVLTRTSATLGDRTCVLTVAFDQGQGDQGRVAAQVVPATFTVTAEDATPEDGRLDFGTRTVGSGAIDRTVTFTNLSSVTYPVFDCSRGGDGFALVSACPSEWPAHGSITLTMRFTPGAVGQASGAISLGTIGLGGHTTAWLSADVVPAPPAPDPPTPDPPTPDPPTPDPPIPTDPPTPTPEPPVEEPPRAAAVPVAAWVACRWRRCWGGSCDVVVGGAEVPAVRPRGTGEKLTGPSGWRTEHVFMSSPNMSVVAAPSLVAPSSASSSASAVDDPVPSEVHAVIDLFASQLAKVAFPEIDAASLRRQAEELRTEAKAVARAREALEVAQQGFASRLSALTDTAGRAVAYARIYSEAHPDRTALATAIAALSEPRTPPPPTLTANGKRRGRPPRRSAELFDAAAPAVVADEPA